MLKVGSHWYVSTLAVMFGILFSDYKEKIIARVHLIPAVLFFIPVCGNVVGK